MKKVLECISHSPEETESFAHKIARKIQSHIAIGLVGEIGSGKTHFVKGIAAGIGLDRALITSPTFTIVNSFLGKFDLYHLDIYRLSSYNELEYIGFNDLIYPTSVIIIEWYDRMEKDIGVDLKIEFTYIDANIRKLLLFVNPTSEHTKLWI